MLLRCASRMMTGPVRLAAGLTLLGGIAAGAAVGAGVLGGVLLVRRMREERQGWRAAAGSDDLHADAPAPDGSGITPG